MYLAQSKTLSKDWMNKWRNNSEEFVNRDDKNKGKALTIPVAEQGSSERERNNAGFEVN